MDLFLQRVFDSLSNGSAYAALAVAIAMVFRTAGVLNLAQGQMAMLSAYIAFIFVSGSSPFSASNAWLEAIGTPWPVWAGIAGAVAVSMVLATLLERFLIRPIGGTNPAAIIGATLGLYLLLDAFVVEHWGSRRNTLGSPFPDGIDDRFDIAGARLWFDTIGITLTMLTALILLAIAARQTQLGLAYRALTSNRNSAKLVGVRVERVVMLGWALAAGLGALAGGLIAGYIGVYPAMMSRLLIFGLAAATLGGLRSPLLAFAGGYLFAFGETMMGGYVDFIDSQVTLAWALGVLIIVLSVRPSGLSRRSLESSQSNI